jgi:hypothetical protein
MCSSRGLSQTLSPVLSALPPLQPALEAEQSSLIQRRRLALVDRYLGLLLGLFAYSRVSLSKPFAETNYSLKISPPTQYMRAHFDVGFITEIDLIRVYSVRRAFSILKYAPPLKRRT